MPDCPTPDKKRFSNEREARVNLARVTLSALRHGEREGTYPTRAYLCACRGWHLTHRESWPVENAARG